MKRFPTTTTLRRIILSFLIALDALGVQAPVSAHAAGVNDGTLGSTCAASDGGLVYTPPGPGISTTWLGTAPAYYELGSPEGAYLNQPAKGVMMIIHGGGWYVVGAAAVGASRFEAEIWRNRGWATLNITYRACDASVGDVLWFHDTVRSVAPTLPICAWGASAGAHLALMLASLRSDVSCVIAEAAPTDLQTFGSQPAYNPVTRQANQTSGPFWAYNLGVAAFGSSQLAAMSPALHPGKARLFLATALQDEFIPWGQAQEMAAAAQSANPGTYVDTDQVAAGSAVQFTHTDLRKQTGISLAAYNDYLVRQLRLVAPVVAPAGVTGAVINDYRAPSLGYASLGNEEYDMTLSSTQLTATTSGRVELGAGNQYLIQSCVAYFAPTQTLNNCNQITVDTRANKATASATLPTATAVWSRPAAGTGSGFAYGVSWLSFLSHGQWVQIASTIPDTGFIDTGLSVPAEVVGGSIKVN